MRVCHEYSGIERTLNNVQTKWLAGQDAPSFGIAARDMASLDIEGLLPYCSSNRDMYLERSKG